jgi:hypothetical protein
MKFPHENAIFYQRMQTGCGALANSQSLPWIVGKPCHGRPVFAVQDSNAPVSRAEYESLLKSSVNFRMKSPN